MARRIAVEIVGDASSLERSFKQAQRSTQKFNRDISKTGRGVDKSSTSFKSFGRSVLGGNAALLGAAGLAAGLRASFDEMASAQKVAAQTAAVLESTGGAANVTAKHVDELALSLLKKSGVDDEVIASGENVLLTFRKIRNETGKGNDVFDQATKATLDLSVALGKDMQSSAILVGKALNDPIKGLTALTRAGVQFDAAQKNEIKSLVATGQTVRAQKVILAELNSEFGKSAEAAGKTLPGQLSILRESLRNTGGTAAQDLAPSLELVLGLTNKLVEAGAKVESKSVKGRLGHFGFLLGSPPIEATKKFAESVNGLAGAFGKLKKNTTGLQGAVGKPGQVPLPPGMQGLLTPGMLPDRVKRTAGQRNDFFDAMIGRKLDRVQDAPLRAQLKKLQTIAGLITKRIAATKDITRKLSLEDQLLEVQRRQKDVRAQLTQQTVDRQQQIAALLRQQQEAQKQQAAAAKAAAAHAAETRAAATQTRMDWLQLALEKAQATKPLADDVKALKRIIAFIKQQIKLTGRTVDLARQLFQTEQQLADVNKQRKAARKPARAAAAQVGWDWDPISHQIVPTGMFGPLGRAPAARRPPPPASGFGAGGIAIQTVNVYGVTNVKEFEGELQRRAQGRPQTRRGPV